jgi:hypothetical protein
MKQLLKCLGVVSSIAMMGCDEDKPKYHHVLNEVIDVQGMCCENHVGRRDNYAGQIVRWQTVETGKVSTYGFVSKGLSLCVREHKML